LLLVSLLFFLPVIFLPRFASFKLIMLRYTSAPPPPRCPLSCANTPFISKMTPGYIPPFACHICLAADNKACPLAMFNPIRQSPLVLPLQTISVGSPPPRIQKLSTITPLRPEILPFFLLPRFSRTFPMISFISGVFPSTLFLIPLPNPLIPLSYFDGSQFGLNTHLSVGGNRPAAFTFPALLVVYIGFSVHVSFPVHTAVELLPNRSKVWFLIFSGRSFFRMP